MKRVVVAAFALALLALTLLLLFQDDPSPSSGAPASETVADDESRTAPASSEPVDPAGTGEVSQSAAERALDEERLELPTASSSEEPDSWIEGVVDLSLGCESDPTLEVFCLSTELDQVSLARVIDPDRNSEGATNAALTLILSRVPVEAGGRFRLPRPADAKEAHVVLRGRWLYMARSVRHDLSSSAPLVLVPERGALLRVDLHARDDAPLGKVVVTCESATPTMDPSGSGYLRFESRADSDGAAEFRALPAGVPWQLIIVPERHAAQKSPVEPLPACDSRSVERTLERGGAVAGRVLAEEDAPVVGAEVTAFWRGRFFGFDDPKLREAKTDESGAFRIEALPPGPVSLQASIEGFLESSKEQVEVPEEGTLDGLIVRISRGSSVAGRVTWPDGASASAIEVKVEFDFSSSGGGMGFFAAMRGAEGKATTDETGAFRVTGLGKGPFLVSCTSGSAASAAPVDEEGTARTTPSPEEPIHRARAKDVAPGTEDLLLVLQPPPGLWGRAVDPAGAPVTAFEVDLHEKSGGMFGAFTSERHEKEFASEDGRFYFGDLTPGSWELVVRGETHATLEAVTVELPSTSEADPLVVTLIPTATVAGIVRSPSGEAVPGATVHESSGGGGWQAALADRQRDDLAVKTDEQGRFRYQGLLPGSVSLYAEAPQWARGPVVSLELAGGQTVEDVELLLLQGGTLTGEVFDAEGRAAPGRTVSAQLLSNYQQKLTTTDATGSFRIDHMPPGSWQIASMNSTADWSGGDEGFDAAAMLEGLNVAQADIVDGQESHVVLGGAPKDPVRVHGRVTHHGEPYRGAMLSFFATGDRPLDSMNFTTVDEQGDYEMTLEGGGGYVVSVAKISGAPGQQSTVEFPCEIPSAPEHRLDFQIPHGRISGRVIGPDGAPAADARITLAPDGVARSDSLMGGQYTEIEADDGGRYVIDGLRAGTYRVSAGGAAMLGMGADASTGRVTRGGLRVADEQWLQDVDFRLEAPGSLEILVRDANGAPASGATVFVRDGEGRISEAMSFHQTDGSGRCRYPGLAPGSYTALARLSGSATTESAPVAVRTGEEARLELALGEGATLWVRFRLDDGPEVPAHVRVSDSAGRDVTGLLGLADIQAMYAQGGFSPTEYKIGPLAPGKYQVHAWTDEGKSAKKTIDVRPGEREQRFTFRLVTE